jgi:peroxiredoxin
MRWKFFFQKESDFRETKTPEKASKNKKVTRSILFMKRLGIFFAVLALLCGSILTSGTKAEGEFAVGSKTENFKLPDTSGTIKSFDELKGEKGAVVVFLSIRCPMVVGYNARIKQLATDYKSKGINLIGINSNSDEAGDKVKSHAADNYSFPVLIDKNNVFADKFAANATPEVFYFDETGKLLYRGAIDNDRKGETITATYLRDALDSGIAGKEIKKATTNGVGCSIKRVAKN